MSVFPAEINLFLIANDINVSIFKPTWFSKLGIIQDDDILDDYSFASNAVRVPTNECELIVLPKRIQWRPAKNLVDYKSNAMSMLGSIVRELPHTPFTAVGANFEHIVKLDTNLEDWSKERLSSSFTGNVCGEHAVGVRYTAAVQYVESEIVHSYECLHGRVSDSPEKGFLDALQVKPGEEIVQLNSNYHLQLDVEDPRKQIMSFIRDIDLLLEKTKAVANKLLSE